jgi:tetratricopeptide (TPR) repeat protein
MVKPCPNCGTPPVPEARFCRLCGTPLKTGSSVHESGSPVSPLAQTIPLAGEGRATDGLGSDDPRRPPTDTSKVGRAEMENLLRRTPPPLSSPAQGKQIVDGDGDKAAPQTTTLVSEQAASAPALAAVPDSGTAPTAAATASAPAQPSANVRARRMWQVLAVVLLCVALVAGVLAFILSRRGSSVDADESSPISISDQKQLVNEKLSEAETLLASGEFNRAITVLRAAVKLDPSSVEAHMRLGNALERTGARAEAIEEYNAATQSNPNEVAAWRALAAAQFEEKLYGAAAESYRRLIAVVGDGNVDDETWLLYADALRLAERVEEARTVYQKISSSASPPIAQTARQRLVELGPSSVAAAGSAEQSREERVGRESAKPTVSPTPLARTTPTPAPAVPNTTQTDPDTYYFMGLNTLNGRDPKKLTDGELAAALNYFLRAQSGTHGAEARRYAERLGREYDRRRKR